MIERSRFNKLEPYVNFDSNAIEGRQDFGSLDIIVSSVTMKGHILNY
jgi:hypothetical protein